MTESSQEKSSRCPVCEAEDYTIIHEDEYHPMTKAATIDYTTVERELIARCDGCGIMYDPEVQ